MAWTNRIQPLTPELSCEIAKTLDVCDKFLKGHADEFDDEPGGIRNNVIIEIEQHTESLHRVQKHFDAMTSICGVYASNVSPFLTLFRSQIASLTFDRLAAVSAYGCAPEGDGSRQQSCLGNHTTSKNHICVECH